MFQTQILSKLTGEAKTALKQIEPPPETPQLQEEEIVILRRLREVNNNSSKEIICHTSLFAAEVLCFQSP
jgi:hypothetical protein